MKHHPYYTDIPIWLRVSDGERKKMTNINLGNEGKSPANARIDWQQYEAEIIDMLEEGKSPPQIASRLKLNRDLVVSKCRHLVETGRAMA